MQLRLLLALLSEPYHTRPVYYQLVAGMLWHQSVMIGFVVSPVVVYRMQGQPHDVH